MPLLLQTPLIDISESDGVVRAVVQNRPDADPLVGASSARQMSDFVRDEVAVPSRPYRGMVLDVRAGLEVFGPKTRDALEAVFRSAEEFRIPIAVIVAGTTQRMQFDSMAGIYAPSVGRVVTSDSLADDHVRSSPTTTTRRS